MKSGILGSLLRSDDARVVGRVSLIGDCCPTLMKSGIPGSLLRSDDARVVGRVSLIGDCCPTLMKSGIPGSLLRSDGARVVGRVSLIGDDILAVVCPSQKPLGTPQPDDSQRNANGRLLTNLSLVRMARSRRWSIARWCSGFLSLSTLSTPPSPVALINKCVDED